jgi:long-chain fatty acid transport protein
MKHSDVAGAWVRSRTNRVPPLTAIALRAVALSLLLSTPAGAIGLRIPNQDPEANARANAFVATADNPSAIYYNPAGIGQNPGSDLQLGVLTYMGVNVDYRSPSGADTTSRFHALPLPEIYCTYNPTNQPFAFGVGLYFPYGLGVDWPQNTGFRSISIDSELEYARLNPVIVWKAHPQLSLAVGPMLDYSLIKFTRGLASPSDQFVFNGSGYAFGFNAGVLWQPVEQWSFGATYRSATTVDYHGHADYNPGVLYRAHTTANVDFPQTVVFGVSYRPTPKWNLEVDADWANWGTLNTVTLSGTKNIFGQNFALPLNWHDSWLYEIGATRYLDNGWFVSTGFFYCTDTSGSVDFTPAIPDTELYVGCLGFGHKGEHWHWAFAAQWIEGPGRSITDSQPNPATHESGNGTYRILAPTLSLSAGYHF